MARYGYTAYFLLVSLCFWFCPMVLSQLSHNQTSTMTTLSQLLNGNESHVPWNAVANPNPCNWKGVTCSRDNSSITKIVLSGSSISYSTFLPVVCKIETLEHLDLSMNLLSSIPGEFITECGKIKGLKLLNFSRNRIEGSLPSFEGFDGLEYLDMSYNVFHGKIDPRLTLLASLKHLNLWTNNLSGSIPSNIGNLSKLDTLILSSNKLSGEIPKTLVNIVNLTRFAANSNTFTGSVPRGITKSLRSLDLSYNKLSGPIPEDLLSQPNLQVVDLSSNNLSGPLPAKISSRMVRLRLGDNKLNGTISPSTFAALQKLMYMELQHNELTGQIPDEVRTCQSLALLNLGQNQLSGELPAVLGSLSNLQVLRLEMNRFTGQIPIEIGQLQRLLMLNLSWNSLDGTIPSAMSNLGNLTNLNLQENNLGGSVPRSISSMFSLMELQLGGNRLIGEIPKMPSKLQIALNLSSNYFSGPIPITLDGLYELEILDLSNNNFSGGIPDFLTNMESLIQLKLSNNQLSGVIPNFKSHVELVTAGNKDLISNNASSNTFSRSAKKGNSVVVAVLVAMAAAVFLVGLVTLLVVSISRRLYRVNDEQLQPQEDLQPPQVIQGNLLTTNGIHRSNIDFSKAMEAVSETSNITLKTRFSTYYKTIMPSGSIYFVKKLNWSDKLFPLGSHDKFGKELEVLAKLNNSNVMTPLAYILSTDSAYILYEFISNGSLYDALHGSMRSSLDWASRYSIAVGVAQGLSFLHGFASNPILLLDLSSKSIMLKSLREPLVGDIELYKVIDPSRSTGSFSAVAGSVGYIPPEYAYTMRVTMAGNVYSFGVILLELLTGKDAVTNGTELVKWVLRNSAKKDHILDFHVSRTSQAVRNQMLAILKVALACVSTSPEARPKMKSVLRMILNAR